MPTSFILNGKPVSVDLPADMPILWVLRDGLNLTGTKFGCGVAACGACTIHLNGEAVRGCQTTLADVADAEVTTIEGLPGTEGAFLLCSFELVSALVLAGRPGEAREIFDRLAGRAGPLGLHPEERAPDGTALGNFPQAFTHLALIEAALNLDSAGDRDALHAWAERSPAART